MATIVDKDDSRRLAAAWLDRTYGGRVALAESQPFAERARTWLFSCQYADGPVEPMLAATLAVPKDGGEPFPVANTDPLDEQLNAPDGTDSWRRRVNARNCLVATDAAVRHRPASALPWRPEDEMPGWWDRLLTGVFAGAEVATCASWSEVADAVVTGGPGTHAAVWLRRELDGLPLTGHLLYAQYRDGGAMLLDGQRGSLARCYDDEVGSLVVARLHRPEAGVGDPLPVPWQRAAPHFAAAVAKAQAWLEHTYAGEAVLVDPGPGDETRRGWLFACTTRRFADTGDWREQMLDAALVVPKAAGEPPFGLPNPDPWTWMTRWDDGEPDLPAPPAPGPAAWYASTMDQIGAVLSAHAHQDWAGAVQEIVNFPEDARALVWVRRQDYRGRETVGNLIVVANERDNVRFVDGMAEDGKATFEANAACVHVIRYR
ncbi:YrhB domain-containing protein [Kibdelosporangium phytohabitans]|uniref:Papain fold toxin 1 (Glutamine deamidase) of polymorphic toxin system n=1 Tax=Kibdelosporangium phytohabitans TaxID=860235 RepID=A0A0N9IF46_9PSEU|nr:YrhB domain-containing protein [Kibdelosporangium phytohabitans]ALG15138.1 hypothetical protein AOZ06_28755 [Kibdelosporangium phytohabitans]MBE1461400.1 hypothetical protein [Kibdelosporangium phytohabitans]